MTSYRRFMAFCFALAVWFWCSAAAFAEAPPAQASPQPPDEHRQALVEAPPWYSKEWVERRYKIEAMRFRCRDETGIDWLGSDEVMVGTSDAKGSTVSNEIGDIDSGDTHDFDPAKSCIVAVRPGIVVLGETSVCDDFGEPAPLGFGVEFWEKDINFPPGFCSPVELPPGSPLHAGPHCLNDGSGDDFIGRASVDFASQELEIALPKVGDEYIETVVLDPCENGGVCGGWDLPDYTFTYRVTRLPDVRVEFQSVLDVAMRRSGAGSELEAVAAGLRSLRAKSPRKTEPEKVNPP